MKKTFKAILTVFSAVALAITAIPSGAKAAVADNTAFLAFADSAWTYQWWGEEVDTGVTGVNAEVTGVGTYTVSLDFTGTKDGKASGIAFTAPMIEKGEQNFPGYIIQIDAVEVNGKDIALTGKTYTSCDNDGKLQMRTNLYNTWVPAGKESDPVNNPRTIDGSFDGVSAAVVNPDDFASVETYSVTFTLIDPNAAATDTSDDAAAADDKAATDDTTATAATAAPKTGVATLGVVYGLGALATGAAALRKKSK